jgi:hypothetical protein
VRRWRLHGEPGNWTYCQDANCEAEHYLYHPFAPVNPQTVGKWEGIKHKPRSFYKVKARKA